MQKTFDQYIDDILDNLAWSENARRKHEYNERMAALAVRNDLTQEQREKWIHKITAETAPVTEAEKIRWGWLIVGQVEAIEKHMEEWPEIKFVSSSYTYVGEGIFKPMAVINCVCRKNRFFVISFLM